VTERVAVRTAAGAVTAAIRWAMRPPSDPGET
jgi:hypothetical protein